MNRRRFLATAIALIAHEACAVDYPRVVPGTELSFPRDYGSHPPFRIEWWYLTGIARDASGSEYGIQVTFFRNRPDIDVRGDSAFAPRQLLFAHAALGDPQAKHLRHDQRAARAGFGLAEAAEDTTRVSIGPWSLERIDDVYAVRIAAREFSFDLRFKPTAPMILEGDNGFSRKGPHPAQASYYYSEPQLDVSGSIAIDGRDVKVTGIAWLDHEWSSEVMAADAVGWDWTGINLDDGGALMAFAMRGAANKPLWAGGTLRAADGRTQVFAPDEIAFLPLRTWRSPRTGVDYPVAMKLRAGGDEYLLEPLFDDHELDARASTGTLYWEGAVRAQRRGSVVGRGYLELTGYGKPVRW